MKFPIRGLAYFVLLFAVCLLWWRDRTALLRHEAQLAIAPAAQQVVDERPPKPGKESSPDSEPGTIMHAQSSSLELRMTPGQQMEFNREIENHNRRREGKPEIQGQRPDYMREDGYFFPEDHPEFKPRRFEQSRQDAQEQAERFRAMQGQAEERAKQAQEELRKRLEGLGGTSGTAKPGATKDEMPPGFECADLGQVKPKDIVFAKREDAQWKAALVKRKLNNLVFVRFLENELEARVTIDQIRLQKEPAELPPSSEQSSLPIVPVPLREFKPPRPRSEPKPEFEDPGLAYPLYSDDPNFNLRKHLTPQP